MGSSSSASPIRVIAASSKACARAFAGNGRRDQGSYERLELTDARLRASGRGRRGQLIQQNGAKRWSALRPAGGIAANARLEARAHRRTLVADLWSSLMASKPFAFNSLRVKDFKPRYVGVSMSWCIPNIHAICENIPRFLSSRRSDRLGGENHDA